MLEGAVVDRLVFMHRDEVEIVLLGSRSSVGADNGVCMGRTGFEED